MDPFSTSLHGNILQNYTQLYAVSQQFNQYTEHFHNGIPHAALLSHTHPLLSHLTSSLDLVNP